MWTVIESPIGPLRIIEQAGAITAIEFSRQHGGRRLPGSLLPPGAPETGSAVEPLSPFRDNDGRPRGPRADDAPVLVEAARQLEEYFARDRKEFELPLAPIGTGWQLAVWDQLKLIGYGETASYGQVAARLGKSNAASRAVGLANGANPIPIVIPCHRVIGANGTLTGYAGGLDRKQLLLGLEQDALF